MTDIFEKNMEAYKKKYLTVADKIINTDEKVFNTDNGYEVGKDRDKCDTTIYYVNKDGRRWYLDSRINSKELASLWSVEFAKTKFESIYLVFGFGNGEKIRNLAKTVDKSCFILVYEPCKELFNMAMNDTDITELIENDNIAILFKGLLDETMYDVLWNGIQYENINQTQIISLPNYDKLFGEELEVFWDKVNQVYEAKVMTANTVKSFGKEINSQRIKNIEVLFNCSTVDMVKERLDELEINNKTAILVSGGPSLDKNVDLLEKAIGKCFVLCVDTAIRSMLRRNLIPDAMITIDSHKPLELFEDERVVNIPVIGCMQSRADVLAANKCRRLMYGNDTFTNNFFKEMGREVPTLETNGSVANDGFAFLRHAGFTNIILIGQDCAFTGNKKHNSDSYKEAEFEVKPGMFLVEGNDGEMVYTDSVFDNYRRFFELEMDRYESLNVINATEGGAKIKGAQIMTLAQAIEKYCTEEIDYKSILKELPNLISEEKYEEAKRIIKGLPDRLDSVEIVFDELLIEYEKIKEMADNKKIENVRLKEILNTIDEKNAIVDKEKAMEFIITNMGADEMKFKENIYDVQDEVYEELMGIYTNGKNIVEGYKDQIPVVKEMLREVIEKLS